MKTADRSLGLAAMTKKARYTDARSRWTALIERDRAAEGAFYYAVKTTGVFCRPGCSSRLPRRENVEFFDTCQQAQRAGYRPCQRCRPGAVSPRERLAEAIVLACRRLEQAEKPPTLEQLAAEAGLSPWHFQRRFKQIVGVTPKQYAATQQAQRFRAKLKTSRSVTEAIYEAGFGSSSRAYDSARDRLAMAPSTYRRGGAGLTICYGTAQCFLGWVIVAATDHGVCAIAFGDDPHTLPSQLQQSFPKAQLEEAGPDFTAVIQKVIAFIETPGDRLGLPLDIRGTAFQLRVWQLLRDIPPGEMASYAEIARRLGHPKSVRAVARACAANRLAVAIPCHRVVRKDGRLGGYRWGLARKQALLRRESNHREF